MRRPLALALLLALSGCVPLDAPAGADGVGYREVELEPDVFLVSFAGGSPPMAQDLALLRCAELTLETNHDYFEVLDASGESEDQTDWHRYWCRVAGTPVGNEPVITCPGGTVSKTVGAAAYKIRLLKEAPPSGQAAYDAASLRRALRDRYSLDTQPPMRDPFGL